MVKQKSCHFTIGNQNGWNEYSRLVLKELETLGDSIDGLRSELVEVKQELAKIQSREDRVDELRAWKSNIDEVASPTQLKEALNEISKYISQLERIGNDGHGIWNFDREFKH